MKKRKPIKKPKRRLFKGTSDSFEKTLKDCENLLPYVLSNLIRNNTLCQPFLNFLILISTNSIPLDNIALLLFDVVEYYVAKMNTRQMIYSPETMKFGKVCCRQFNGKFLRFMTGDRESHHIHFADPTEKTIRNFNGLDLIIPRELKPGIIKEAFPMLENDKRYVISVDGKNTASGLTKEGGDIDLFGHEPNGDSCEKKDSIHIYTIQFVFMLHHASNSVSLK
ncbi:unnamed protein product [Owenia fusiformis]|uniref:Uncharacterized protein n=1 Tax=Owenia fusiformis TaxID=6347 RepID=A0A8S4N2G2_OWEFU|nr:unnamed protein product [Owenia fusiformis]